MVSSLFSSPNMTDQYFSQAQCIAYWRINNRHAHVCAYEFVFTWTTLWCLSEVSERQSYLTHNTNTGGSQQVHTNQTVSGGGRSMNKLSRGREGEVRERERQKHSPLTSVHVRCCRLHSQHCSPLLLLCGQRRGSVLCQQLHAFLHTYIWAV